jgi:hypothetical protein
LFNGRPGGPFAGTLCFRAAGECQKIGQNGKYPESCLPPQHHAAPVPGGKSRQEKGEISAERPAYFLINSGLMLWLA